MKEVFNILLISLLFSVVLSLPDFRNFLIYLPLSFIFFPIHYVFHEITARYFGLKTGFKLLPKFTILSFVFSIFLSLKFPFRILIPGNIEVFAYKFKFRKKITYEEVGAICFSGLFINLLFALLFWLFPLSLSTFIVNTNISILLSTLLPFGELDGIRVLFWKRWVWFLFLLLAIIIMLT